MRLRNKVALSLACGAAAGLLVDFVQAVRQVAIEKAEKPPPGPTHCEEWCVCKCHQQGCGCHGN